MQNYYRKNEVFKIIFVISHAERRKQQEIIVLLWI